MTPFPICLEDGKCHTMTRTLFGMPKGYVDPYVVTLTYANAVRLSFRPPSPDMSQMLEDMDLESPWERVSRLHDEEAYANYARRFAAHIASGLGLSYADWIHEAGINDVVRTRR